MNASRYHPALVALHWLTAILILFSLGMGMLVLEEIPNSAPEKIDALRGHMIAGIAILNDDSSGSTEQIAGAALSDDELAQLDSFLPDLPDPPDQPARLELGRQLIDAGDYDGAMDQYLAVLEEGPNAEALAFVGFITNASGDPALAQHLLEQSLAIDPDYLTATWFLANVKFFGAGDVAGAVPLLEQIVARTDAEPDMVEGARRMLAAAADLEIPPSTSQP